MKLIAIRNVGRFRSFSAAGDTEFRPLTLLFGENGRGKTTLCAILRSLQNGNPESILSRSTLGAPGAPEICIRLSTGMAKFSAGAWDITHADMTLFDTTFVHENVYAGDYVDHQHKKNLYRVIVGEHGVRLASRVDELDEQIRESNRTLTESAAAAKALVPKGVEFEEFLRLPDHGDVDKKIASQESVVLALERSADIKAKAQLAQLTLPNPPDGIDALLARTLDNISADADELIRQHMHSHTNGASEAWLADGLAFTSGDTCPFCAQSLVHVDLVKAYRAYFSESYRGFKHTIADFRMRVTTIAGGSALLMLQKAIEANARLSEFWRQFISIEAISIEFAEIREALQAVQTAALACIDQKLLGPLEQVPVSDALTTALSRYQTTKSAVASYNEAVDRVNAAVRRVKAETEAGDLVSAKRELLMLRASKERYTPEGAAATRAYESAAREKATLEGEKEQAKQELDNYTTEIFARYESRINQLLDMFSAGFRIVGTTRRYVGGTASTTYQIVINAVPIELGDATTPADSPCFKNTLSAGDRSTLALAFFLAQIEQDPGLPAKTIVLDDPFTSQDRFRRSCTQHLISKLVGLTKQVIVLSHDAAFLKGVWDKVPSATVRTLQIARAGETVVVNEWDIEEETRAGYLQEHGILMAFVRDGTGNARDVVRRIRPFMEGYLRLRFPGHFLPSEWLGDFIQKIRCAGPSSSLLPIQPICSDLEDINDYSKKYHHDQNLGGADTEAINDGELEAYVKRTLNLVGGY